MSDVLSAYKEQSTIEQTFRTVKQPPIMVSPVWLHKPQRIESLLFLVFVDLLVSALLQRLGREKVWPKKIGLRAESRDYLPLTALVLLRAFDSISIVSITVCHNGHLLTEKKCTQLSSAQRAVLLALSFPPPSSYLNPSGIR